MTVTGGGRARGARCHLATALGLAAVASLAGCVDHAGLAKSRATEALGAVHASTLECLENAAPARPSTAETGRVEAVLTCFDHDLRGLDADAIEALIGRITEGTALTDLTDGGDRITVEAIDVGIGQVTESYTNAHVSLAQCWTADLDAADGTLTAPLAVPCDTEILGSVEGSGIEPEAFVTVAPPQ